MDLDEMLVKKYEGMSAKEICKAPIDALYGVSEGDAALMKRAFGVDNVLELANLVYVRRAKQVVKEAKKEGME